MPDLSAFMSTPQEWVEKLALLKDERKKIEDAEDRLRAKLSAHLAEKNLTSVQGLSHIVKIETRESVDWTKKTLVDVLGPEWFLTTEAKLPKRTTSSLVLRAIKKDEAPPTATDRAQEVNEFFGVADKPTASEFFEKRKKKAGGA